MEITDVQIITIKPNNGLLAMAQITLDNELVLSSIGIYKKINEDNIRITYPNKKLKDGRDIYFFNPVTKELSKKIEEAISEKSKKINLLGDYNV